MKIIIFKTYRLEKTIKSRIQKGKIKSVSPTGLKKVQKCKNKKISYIVVGRKKFFMVDFLV